jgi:cobalt/nickel transport system ATP-binding protein
MAILKAMPCTRVLASHDLEMILELCSRVAVMAGGTIVAEGDPATVLAEAALMEQYGLEVPASLSPPRKAPKSWPRQ